VPSGGAIDSTGTVLIVLRCKFTGNFAASRGGAISHSPISHSEWRETAWQLGGLAVVACEFSNNHCLDSGAHRGSAIYYGGGSSPARIFSLSASTFTDNSDYAVWWYDHELAQVPETENGNLKRNLYNDAQIATAQPLRPEDGSVGVASIWNPNEDSEFYDECFHFLFCFWSFGSTDPV
jgi:hypothetical protein